MPVLRTFHYLHVRFLQRFRTYGARILVAEQLLQLLTRGIFARVDLILRHEHAREEIKIFAKIRGVFFLHRIGSAITTLMRDASIVGGAIQTNTQVRAAFVARFAAARLAGDGPLPTT